MASLRADNTTYIPFSNYRGYLSENAGTNRLKWSQQFEGGLTKDGGTIAADASAAPDGTATADMFTDTAQRVASIYGLSATSRISPTVSIYAKAIFIVATVAWTPMGLMLDGLISM